MHRNQVFFGPRRCEFMFFALPTMREWLAVICKRILGSAGLVIEVKTGVLGLVDLVVCVQGARFRSDRTRARFNVRSCQAGAR